MRNIGNIVDRGRIRASLKYPLLQELGSYSTRAETSYKIWANEASFPETRTLC
jgi:hypothetical protein